MFINILTFTSTFIIIFIVASGEFGCMGIDTGVGQVPYDLVSRSQTRHPIPEALRVGLATQELEWSIPEQTLCFLLLLNGQTIDIYVNCEGDRLWDVRVDPMLQVYDGERWKHICFYGERMATAHVACRQQGYTNATSLIQFLMRSDQIVTCPTVSNYFLYGETNIMHCNMTYFGNPFYVFCNALKIIC
uniref:SRCR domain-containing protein n=1 Tax=Amphimedon queenslandica TaxID=400682 RepID=A0A1X7TPS3_AMPQE